MMEREKLERALTLFTGSNTLTRHGLNKAVLFTEGAVFLFENAEAWWLSDAIISYLGDERAGREEFQVWTLRTSLAEKSAVLTLTDGNSKKPIIEQRIPFTDFPLAEQAVWLVREGDTWVGMIPGEY